MDLKTYFRPNIRMLGREDRTCASKCGPSAVSGRGGAALTPAGFAPNSRPARSTPLRSSSRFAVACLLAALASGCRQEEERPIVAQPVRIVALETAGETPFRSFPGEVVAARTVRLSFETSGRLIEFPIQNGQWVNKGDLIGQLDTADFVAAKDSAQAAFTAAKIQFDRYEAMTRARAVPVADLDNARKQLETADANLRTASRALTETRLLAPFGGRIADRIARELQTVRSHEKVAVLEDLSTLEIEINVPERDMMLGGRGVTVQEIHETLEARLEFASMPDQQIVLHLQTFGSRANPVSRTFLLSFAFDPPENKNILPGMTGTVLLRRVANPSPGESDGKQQVRMVPVEALTTHSGASTVWRLDAKTMKVSPVAVEVAAILGAKAMISSKALADGDEIVASGARFLAEGMPVRRMETRNP
jgi:multidrug efflux system membrane fusion protein